jgi:hypothetical protein
MKLPVKTELPENVKRLAEETEAPVARMIRVPSADGASLSPVWLCPQLTLSPSGKQTFLLPIENEHTDLGRGLIRSLWFDEPVTLWIAGKENTFCLTACGYRCHIAGPVFSAVYRALTPAVMTDIAAVWELAVSQIDDITGKGTLPTAVPLPPYEGEPELHLDCPSLHL